jgi:hypothetical protein
LARELAGGRWISSSSRPPPPWWGRKKVRRVSRELSCKPAAMLLPNPGSSKAGEAQKLILNRRQPPEENTRLISEAIGVSHLKEVLSDER